MGTQRSRRPHRNSALCAEVREENQRYTPSLWTQLRLSTILTPPLQLNLNLLVWTMSGIKMADFQLKVNFTTKGSACLRACVNAQARVSSFTLVKSELINQHEVKPVSDAVSPFSPTVCGYSSEIKQTTVVPRVGGPAATKQQAFPNHNLPKSPHMKSGLVLVEQAVRQPGAPPLRRVPPRQSDRCPPWRYRESSCRMASRIKTHRPIQGDAEPDRNFAASLSCPTANPSCTAVPRSSWFSTTSARSWRLKS